MTDEIGSCVECDMDCSAIDLGAEDICCECLCIDNSAGMCGVCARRFVLDPR